MPTYDYKCAVCGILEDIFEPMNAPERPCPSCGAIMTRLVSGGVGVIFRGPGFYQTDYKNKGAKNGDD